MLMATRTWFTTAILVLIAIIIMLVVMLGYLVRRTTAKKEVVVVLKNTDQPLTETTSEAVAMSQLQTSTEPGNQATVCVCVCACCSEKHYIIDSILHTKFNLQFDLNHKIKKAFQNGCGENIYVYIT